MKKNILLSLRAERGMVLVITLFLMVVVGLIGLAAILTTTTDLKSSRQDRLEKSSFYAADGGVEVVPEVVDYYVENMPDGDGYPDNLPSELQPLMKDQYFTNEVMGYASHNDASSDGTDASPDVEFAVEGREVDVDVDRFHTQHSDGSAAETLLGYEGIGTGLGGGAISIYYRSASKGTDVDNTTNSIEIVYRYVY
jgi:hypothetical protein